jgi:hypothetical protein
MLLLTLVFFGTLLWGSFGEWMIHRFLMHRRFVLLPYPYDSHALGHHRIFRADETYHALDADMLTHITFDPRDYLLILVTHVPVIVGLEWLTGVAFLAPVVALAVVSYTGAFDILHWAYHVPRGRWMERWRWFKWLKENHRLHHEMQDRRFNVVLPIADFVLRTGR